MQRRFLILAGCGQGAEAAKLKLGQKSPADGSTFTFTVSEQQISELLTQSSIKFNIQNAHNINVTLDSQQFEIEILAE